MRDYRALVRERLPHLEVAPERALEIVEELALQLEQTHQSALDSGADEAEAEAAALAQCASWRGLEQELVAAETPVRAAVPMLAAALREPEPTGSVGRWLAGLHRDLLYAFRQLRLHPTFAVAVALTLGLGMGVNTSLFSVANALLLRPLELPERDRLVNVYSLEEGFVDHTPMAYPDFRDLRRERHHFADLTAYALKPFALTWGEESRIVLGELVAANYFDVLGVSFRLGRGFAPDEGDEADGAAVTVLSHGAWRRLFAEDPDVIGRTLRINGRPLEVVGVAPPSFRGLMPGVTPEFWVPVGALALFGPAEDPLALRNDRLDNRGSRWAWVVGRLAPGSTPNEAAEEARWLSSRLATEHPETNAERPFGVVPTRSVRFLPGVDGAVFGVSAGLLAVSGLVVLIACANAAGMLLVRGATRHREIAVRMALGAPRGRVVRLLLTEGFVLAALGAIVAVALSTAVNWALGSLRLPLPLTLDLGLRTDWRVVGWAALLSLGATFALAWLPAQRATRFDARAALQESLVRFAPGGRLAKALLVAQVTLSTLLLAGAGLLLRSLSNAHRVDPGFDPHDVALLEIDPSLRGYGVERVRQLNARLAEAAQALPGVEAVSYASHLPLSFELRTTEVRVADGAARNGESGPEVDASLVAPGFFGLMRIPLVSGREFSPEDRAESEPVAVVNETFVERFLPGGNPLGRTVRIGREPSRRASIVGVARDAKYRSLGEAPRPFLYQPIAQSGETNLSLLVRAPNVAALLPQIRAVARSVDEGLPIRGLRTLEDATSASLLLPRGGATLFGLLGLLGLVLASVGLYGTVAQLALHRQHEVGIRMALGASAVSVFGLVVRQGLALAGSGVALGVVGALAVAPTLRFVLYGVDPHDPASFVLAAATLLAVAAAASALPAWRSARSRPQEVLRRE